MNKKNSSIEEVSWGMYSLELKEESNEKYYYNTIYDYARWLYGIRSPCTYSMHRTGSLISNNRVHALVKYIVQYIVDDGDAGLYARSVPTSSVWVNVRFISFSLSSRARFGYLSNVCVGKIILSKIWNDNNGRVPADRFQFHLPPRSNSSYAS